MIRLTLFYQDLKIDGGSATKTLAKSSVEDDHRIIEAGILCDRHVELLRGEIVEMSPETPIHYDTAEIRQQYLQTLLTGQAHTP